MKADQFTHGYLRGKEFEKMHFALFIAPYLRQHLSSFVSDSAESPYSTGYVHCTVQANVKYSCPRQRRVPLQYTGYVQYRKNVKYSCPGQR